MTLNAIRYKVRKKYTHIHSRKYYKMKIQKTRTHDEDDIHRPIVCRTTIEINFNSEFVAIVWHGTKRHRKRVNFTQCSSTLTLFCKLKTLDLNNLRPNYGLWHMCVCAIVLFHPNLNSKKKIPSLDTIFYAEL